MLVSISTMPAKSNFLNYTKSVQNYADFMHLDVCDGQYNTTTCFCPNCAKKINDNSTMFLDCHLMTKNPLNFAKQYLQSGANLISAQIEAFDKKQDILDYILYVHSHNALVGLAIEPQTDVSAVLPYLPNLDVVLVMAVTTGSSGQQFNNIALKKIEWLSQYKKQHNLNYKIEVDGGITDKTAKLVKQSGADIVVSGSFVFNSQNKQQAIQSLK
jgi:ribulose-phosphate 3-epimerase